MITQFAIHHHTYTHNTTHAYTHTHTHPHTFTHTTALRPKKSTHHSHAPHHSIFNKIHFCVRIGARTR